jgi:hypothetical protein
MAILGRPEGIFDLNDSDKCVGSYLTKSDIKEILSVTDNDLATVTFKIIDDNEVIDERQIQSMHPINPILMDES